MSATGQPQPFEEASCGRLVLAGRDRVSSEHHLAYRSDPGHLDADRPPRRRRHVQTDLLLRAHRLRPAIPRHHLACHRTTLTGHDRSSAGDGCSRRVSQTHQSDLMYCPERGPHRAGPLTDRVPPAGRRPASLAAPAGARPQRPTGERAHRALGQAPEPRLVPPAGAAQRGAGVGATQLGRRARLVLPGRPRPLRPTAVRHRRGAPTRASTRVLLPTMHPGAVSRASAAGAVPVHRQQRPFPDRRGAARGAARTTPSRPAAPGSHPKVLHPNAVRVMADRGIDISGRTDQAPASVRPHALRPRHHPVRPGPRGLPRVPEASGARPLEHPGPRPRRRFRRRHLPGVRADRRGARGPHRVPPASAHRTTEPPRRPAHV